MNSAGKGVHREGRGTYQRTRPLVRGSRVDGYARQVTIRMDNDLFEAVLLKAQAHRSSFSEAVNTLVTWALEEREFR